ncbi:efflux RND transporter permease subunit [Myxococcus landrumensis]|uniref:Efflux RND transporter permease subunit n=1 Tax=Myxococcus landrumensis TaxID=2813577 RepID=A0ABX7NFD8_9BACT|nr:efflux RND transporter permease subunit [Myxococcus landrumus]QSQ17546.1 efflux RND transporter permease subunit [Myxococcus landrumus]
MWIVRLALQRPYTFVVAALLLVFVSVHVIREAPTDILPEVDLPVISVVWTYEGLPAQQIERQITQFSEYSLANNVANLARQESQSFDGVSVGRLYLHPGADVAEAMAQVTASSQSITRRMPPGTPPPIILRYSASSVPILQLSFSSETLTESQIYDHVNQRVRPLLGTVQGSRIPQLSGGKPRQITVDLDLEALKAQGLAPHDVATAVSAQNLVLPTGSIKMGAHEYRVTLNSSPESIDALNDIPVRRGDGRVVFLRDVAHVHDGFAVQTNIAREEGRRSIILSVMKTGEASTLEVARRVRELVPTLQAAAPEGLTVRLLADQSSFVTTAIHGLLVEGVIAALLTATMLLLFIGSWRSTLIIAISIPLSVLAAILMLRGLGYSLNSMTLGGLALAVGILVDDATVELENIHRNLAMGKPLTQAILDGAEQIAVPAFVASLSIGIVFISVLFLEGPARYLFLPMGLAVGLAVMASYVLSRTLVPTLVQYLLRAEVEQHGQPATGLFARLHLRFDAGFHHFRERYVGALQRALLHPRRVLFVFALAMLGALGLMPFVGRDFFPTVDSGQLRLHVVAPPGTRIEETERSLSLVEQAVRELIPAEDRVSMIDQIGMPGGYNLALTDTSNVSSADGEVLVVLSPARRRRTDAYVRLLREQLPARFPELGFYFQPADIVTQILNFGLPSPIDVQISGSQREATYAVARKLEAELSQVRGAVDVRLFQVMNAPRLHFDVDRVRSSAVGLTQRDVANNMLLTVSSSSQVSPSFWSDPKTGNSYPVSVRVPESRVASVEDLTRLALPTREGTQLLGDFARVQRAQTPVFVSHVDIQPTFNVRADVQDSDLGSVSSRLERVVERYRGELPPGSRIQVRGQVDSMRTGFERLLLGLLFAAVLVYALMVVNFQSWLDPFIIITALPGAVVGMVVALFVTQTSFSIPSLMGAIMSVGVATANSVLVVSFANEQRLRGASALEAALEAGRVRVRPVLMTALAMGLGMLPMSLGLSEGGEQNAALGCAVIGGLVGATVATLFFVPVVYSLMQARRDVRVAASALEPSVTA